MGSISRTSNLEAFTQAFGEKIARHFEYLKGQTVTGIGEVELNYWVRADVTLSNNEFFEVHHRWSTEEEESEGEESTLEGEISMSEWLSTYAEGQTVKDISVGYCDRDDEAYLFLTLENDSVLDCMLGFKAETGRFSGLAESVLTKDEIEAFYKSKE